MTRVAVDLLAGGHEDLGGAAGTIVDGVLSALSDDGELRVSLVGPRRLAERLVSERAGDFAGRLDLVEAADAVGPGADAVREVRSRRDTTVRVGTRLIRDGVADALVSAGPVEAVVAAARFTVGLLPGATRPGLAVVLGSGGSTVLVDAGAAADANADELAQCAVTGCAYARLRRGVARPRVGVLTPGPVRRTGSTAGCGLLPRAAGGIGDLVTGLGYDFVGAVEPSMIVGGEVDVVLSDGFTGAVVVSYLRTVARTAGQPLPVSSRWCPQEGAFVVGVDGTVVVAPGGSEGTAAGVAGAIAGASAADRAGWVSRQRAALTDLVARRRDRAGLSA